MVSYEGRKNQWDHLFLGGQIWDKQGCRPPFETKYSKGRLISEKVNYFAKISSRCFDPF